jgi:D-lactate dehydrogenase
MKTFVYSTHSYDHDYLSQAASAEHVLIFTDAKLNINTAHHAAGCEAVSIFTSDNCCGEVLEKLHSVGVRYVALRSAGFDHVDLGKATVLGMRVANVPEYSPYSVAEHAVTMLLAMNRKLTESRLLLQLQDFRLDTLIGFDIHGKTIGVIGTGKIGLAFARIMRGFGAVVLACDPVQQPEGKTLGITYVSLEELLKRSDVVSVHCPLNENTRYLLSAKQLALMKKSSILINTSRGGIINTKDLIEALRNETLAGACLDVYEKEKGLFFEDHRSDIIRDDQYLTLQSLKNVLITGHQAFLTVEALQGIASTTISNLNFWQRGERSPNALTFAENDLDPSLQKAGTVVDSSTILSS